MCKIDLSMYILFLTNYVNSGVLKKYLIGEMAKFVGFGEVLDVANNGDI